jgi:murein DD-endopeptidase MepM/ murein hydrolase activator NlpD
MMDHRRHAPVKRRRSAALQTRREPQSRSPLGNARRRRGDVFSSDHAVSRHSGRFRWLISTFLAAGVGALAILVVIAGSMDRRDQSGGILAALQRSGESPLASFRLPVPKDGGLNWSTPKTDRLQMIAGALSTKYIIHDTMRRQVNNRDKIVNKAYQRVVARLAPISSTQADQIPPFNPYKLYAATGKGADADTANSDTQDINVRVVDLLGGLLPSEDGQELSNQEVADLVPQTGAADEGTGLTMRPGFRPDGLDPQSPSEILAERSSRTAPEPLPPNTTLFAKTTVEPDEAGDDFEAREVRVIKVRKGDTLTRIISGLGGEPWQARAMIEAARGIFPDNAAVPGQEVHITLVPSITRTNRFEPVRVSVFSEGHEHKVTIARNAAGEFTASSSPLDERVMRAALGNEDMPQAASLYASFYHAALSQGLPADTIMQILRIHAYETDFRRKVRGGDQVEWFFDTRDEDKGAEGAIGDLLATSISTSGETQKFYRFRLTDGAVDYFDENGNTSRKFLMRRPARGDQLRLASGFGLRRHPILNQLRMHAGIDWAGPIGTPIMAAGAGVIEEAGRKGEFGNYIRIRHANGYKTAYAHQSRFASGISEGVRVRQGQVIGFIGNTGLSSGPHLHFEVLVNNQHVDPMSIQVPRDMKLEGKQLQDFQRERLRIEDLMRRNPVSAKVAEAAPAQ